jgi:hypothetical protein
MQRTLIALIFLSILTLFASGCKEKREYAPLSGGFGVLAKWVGVDRGPSASLCFKTNSMEPKLIWPFLTGAIFITNDLAFFLGDVRDGQGRLGDGRYFAVRGPGLPADISENILKRWAELNGVEFANIRNKYSPLELAVVPTGVSVHFLGDKERPVTITNDWQQIDEFLLSALTHGKRLTNERPFAVYLKEDIKPDKR